MSKIIKEILQKPEEVKKLARIAFDTVDKDHSGTIDQDELEIILSQISFNMGGESISKEEVLEVLDYLDEDHSGTIEFEEFIDLIEDILRALNEY